MNKRLLMASAMCALVAPILIAGCVSIPEQPQLVSQATDDTVSVRVGACTSNSEKPIAQPVSYVTDTIYPATVALDPHGFSIMSWNIYKGSGDNWQQDLDRIGDNQDIILLQEALLKDELKAYLKQRGLHWHLNTAFSLNNTQTGVMTAARLKSSGHCALRTSEPLIRTPKTVLVSRYELAGMPKQLLVANIHGINFTLGLDAYRRQLHSMEQVLARHQGPVVIAGDFNNWSESRTRLITEMIQRLSLEQLPFRNHNRTRVFGSEIDHIFYRGLSVVTHKTYAVSSSDHNPITVTFRATKTHLARKL